MSTLEWSLIRGVIPNAEAGPSRHRQLAQSLVEADFKAVLLSKEARAILDDQTLWDGIVPSSASSSKSTSPPSSSPVPDQLTVLLVAIALLHSFVQANWTGPDLPFSPTDLAPSDSPRELSNEDLNSSALPFLTLRGEPAYHLSLHPSLFLLSRRLFESLVSTESEPQLPSLPWWRLRVHLVHQSLLDEPVAIDSEVLDGVKALLQAEIMQNDQDLLASLHLEIGLLHHSLGQDKLANQEFLAAARASGLEFELTGALGKKTKFQVQAHSQLVLLAESRPREGEADEESVKSLAGEERTGTLPEGLLLNDDTLLEETEFTKVTSTPTSSSCLSHLDPASQPPLHQLDQSLLLSLCLSQHNNAPESGLTASQMMPFLTRVLTHPRNWSIHTTALLLRSRLESTRSRTVERSALQLAALIEQMPTSDSSPSERLRYFHQLPLPSKWEMERELAKRYLSLGVTRSALEIFTRLEMWEDAVLCLQRLEKEEEAETIVRDLLEGRKVESDLIPVLNRAGLSEPRRTKLTTAREAKLLCLLGDLALSSEEASRDPKGAKAKAIEHYEKAWEMSKHTSSRAMRSLGSLRVGAGQYEDAIPCLQAAVEINPLYSRVWFTLGVCFVRLERWTEARDAFRRDVSVDEEDGEGWNNLAAVYLRLGDVAKADGESSTTKFDNKLLAFRALRSGLRHAYSNWRMWQNYMIVAVDVGELSEAARAMTRVIEERPAQETALAVDVDVLDKLVDSVTRDDYEGGETTENRALKPNEGFGLAAVVGRLFDDTILPRVSDAPRIWRSHARLLRWREDWRGAMEDYLRAYRCGIAQDSRVERDKESWKEAVGEIEELVTVLSALGPKVVRGEGEKKGDWRFQARGIVRTFMGRTRESFEGEPEWEKLTELLDDLKRAE